MNIGDRVRLLKGTEEGLITRFLDERTVEVTIDDFPIPVLRAEVVVVAGEEARAFGNAPSRPRPAPERMRPAAPTPVRTTGIFLAFVPLNDRQLTLHLVNDTDLTLLFTYGHQTGQQYAGVVGGQLAPHRAQVVEQLATADFDRWPAFVLQAIGHQPGPDALRAPLVRRYQFRGATFFKQLRPAPVLNQQAYLFQADDDRAGAPPPPATDATARPATVDPQQLRERWEAQRHNPPRTPVARPAQVVDLHIERLTARHAQLSSAEKLTLQLEVFTRALDQAVSAGLDEVTFIHGVGGGTLRQRIQKQLGQEPHVAWFEDAQKEKFGYGATKAKIKS